MVSFRLRTSPAPRTAVFRPVQRGSEATVPFPAGKDARLSVDPNTDSVDSLGEGNVGTGESGARTASTEAAVNRDDDIGAAGYSGAGFATRSW